jgi:hypothetical protein
MKYGLLFLALFISSISFGQSKQDYKWIFGNDSNGQPGFGALKIDFNVVPFEIGTRSEGLSFDQNNASVSDNEGNLLFYTNGCAIAGADHEIIMNGDSINAGPFFDTFWLGDCDNGYPGKQDIIILNDPGNENGYYIIHKTREFEMVPDNETFIKFLKYTYVDFAQNQGNGEVLEKNTPFYSAEESKLLWSYLSAIRHQNGMDWWILQPHWEENRYLSILLNENGFESIDTLNILRPHSPYSSAGGDARFSPDGNLYAYYNKQDGLHVYDFYRTSGELSEPRSYYPHRDEAFFSSVEFSSNSQLLYFMTSDSLWQADLSFENLEDGIEFIAEWNGINDPFATTFFHAVLAPDCRIYIRSGSSTRSVHVINKPNEKGQACNFVQQGIQFPFTNSTGSWPNFPRWRVDEEEKCDPSIVSLFGELVFYRRDLDIFPNPTTGPLTIELPEDQKSGQLQIIDNNGKQILREELDKTRDTYQIDLSAYPFGIYHVEYLPRDNKERLIYTGKVVLR